MADEVRVPIPNEWAPKEHQLPFWRYFTGGGLRGLAVWHRRGGKDSTALNLTCRLAHQRVGTYWHMLPEKEQARKAIWMGIDRQGRRIIDQVFPLAIRKRTVDDEMFIELKCGSIWQVVGSDNYNSLVGANPVGVVFSEYSVGNPAAWDYLRPILAENGGWAMFLYTPRGKNHGKKLYDMARKNPDWHCELLTVSDTLVLSPEVIQAERDSGMDDDMIQQEYFCSWEGVRQGSIYGQAIAKARADGRIGKFPMDRRFPVNTFWDIGHSDTTSIWFHQLVQGRDRFCKAIEDSGQDVPFFAGKLRETGFVFGKHYLPHDCKNVTLASKSNQLGKNVWDQLFSLGFRDLVQVPRVQDKWTAINLTRTRLDTAEFDEEGCAAGINALESYHKKWDEERKTFLNDPVHDWSSNFADAIRQWATGYTGELSHSSFTVPPPNAVRQGGPGGAPLPYVRTVGNNRTGY